MKMRKKVVQNGYRSKPPKVEPRPIDEVKLTKHEYGVEKPVKLHTVNQWDCRPVSRRIVNPNKARSLRERLCVVQQSKADAAGAALVSATNEAEKKKAYRRKCMIEKYGTCCFLQLLDNDPAPVESRTEILKQERLALAEAKKKKFQDELSSKLLSLSLDHCYSSSVVHLGDIHYEGKKPQVSKDLVDQFFQSHVCLGIEKATELERSTQLQHCCEVWHTERKYRITASIMKEVCHRKDTTSCHSFIQRKLMPKQINTKAVRYGKDNEELAIKAYVNCLRKDDRIVNVNKCGLVINPG